MSNSFYRIRLCARHYLIFFLWLVISACTDKRPSEITLLWKNDRVTGISISAQETDLISDSLASKVIVRLKGNDAQAAMLGDYKVVNGDIIFEPLVAFTAVQVFEVLVNNRFVSEIKIPRSINGTAPALVALYPTQDTAPENLLKIYLQFSTPMREGQSIQYLTLIKNNNDTVRDVFLDLESELWNSDRTMLTVWLDPGRIKRGLQPNLRSGNPLQQGEHYTLVISDKWKNVEDSALSASYNKMFFVTSRDTLSPRPGTWILNIPRSGTAHSLDIDLLESLDFSLLNSALHIVDKNKNAVMGAWNFLGEEKKTSFSPAVPWQSNRYILNVEPPRRSGRQQPHPTF